MSLYGMMRTGVSGMNAQANRLSTVADNIANSSTSGYKRASTEFSSLLLPSTSGNYNSGGVNTTVRYAISQQGDLKATTSSTDLAIKGDGFFVVQDSSGQTYLTRAGSFVPDDQGRLVNAAGYYLAGYSFANGTPSLVANGFGGLELVNVSAATVKASPSTAGTFTANLPVDADVVDPATTDTPADNTAGSTFTNKTSLTVFDNVGRDLLLDIYFTKTANNNWEVAVFNQADATPGTSFPYSSGPLMTQALTFDPSNGELATGSPLSIPVPNGQTLALDVGSMTELGGGFSSLTATVNGSAPAGVTSIEFAADGTVYAQYENGTFEALYRVPLATVASPDKLSVLSGNIYAQSADSGNVQLGFPGEGGLGGVVSGALENSTVDIAEELTNMIESQRSYTANSKVFQTGSELMDVLVNIVR